MATMNGEQKCPYCGSIDTIDCGDIGNGEHHFECHNCRCGFPAKPETGEEV